MILPDDRRYIELFEAIFFDLDGTLVNLHIEWNEVRLDMLAAFNSVCGEEMPQIGINSLINLAFERGCTNARQIAAEILDKHESSAEFDPIREVIDLLKSTLCRKKVAVVTNNLHSTVERVLKGLGLFNHDICVIGFEDVKHSKPNPEGILLALRELGIKNGQAIMIGDRDSDKKAAFDSQIYFCHVKELIGFE